MSHSGLIGYITLLVWLLDCSWCNIICLFDYRFKIPVQWLTSAMNEIGLETFVQNYSFKYPHNILKGKVS